MSRRVAVVLAGVLLLVGCAPESSTDFATDPTPEPTESLDAESVVEVVDIVYGPAEVEVTVHPLVRADDQLVLTLDLATTSTADIDRISLLNGLDTAWGSRSRVILPQWAGIRLMDLQEDLVLTPAVDAAGNTVTVEGDEDDDARSERLQLVFADPGADALALFLPQGGVVPDIPVIDDTPPAVGEESIALDSVESAPIFPMISYTVDLASTTLTEQDADRARIALGADVVFAFDSADLTEAAQAVLTRAATEITTREPGTVRVVGHTDSDGPDAYNQELSERRAASVAAALEALVDTAQYPLDVSGRGESEPVATNDSQEGRAQNRRVELVIETERLEDGAADADRELGDIDGPTATGSEGLDIHQSRPWHVSARRAYVIDDHLVVEIVTAATDDAVDSAFGPAIFEGSFPKPEGLDPMRSMAGVAVMTGTVATMPVLHQPTEADPELVVPLTDLATFARLDGGSERTSVLVYPRGLDVGESVTIDLLGVYVPGWRLTDIPVEQR